MLLVFVSLRLVLPIYYLPVTVKALMNEESVEMLWSVGEKLDLNRPISCSYPSQWWTVASRPHRRTRCCCQAQAPHTAARPCLTVMKASCGGVETTPQCVGLMDGGGERPWSVKVTKTNLPPCSSYFLFNNKPFIIIHQDTTALNISHDSSRNACLFDCLAVPVFFFKKCLTFILGTLETQDHIAPCLNNLFIQLSLQVPCIPQTICFNTCSMFRIVFSSFTVFLLCFSNKCIGSLYCTLCATVYVSQ